MRGEALLRRLFRVHLSALGVASAVSALDAPPALQVAAWAGSWLVALAFMGVYGYLAVTNPAALRWERW